MNHKLLIVFVGLRIYLAELRAPSPPLFMRDRDELNMAGRNTYLNMECVIFQHN